MSVPSVGRLTSAVLALFDDLDNFKMYPTRVPDRPATDAAGLVMAYAVLHPGAGSTPRGALDHKAGHRMWGFTINCVGGDLDYLGWSLDTVTAKVDGQTLVVAGAKVGLMQPPWGFVSAAAQEDPDSRPSRLQVALQYQVLTVPS